MLYFILLTYSFSFNFNNLYRGTHNFRLTKFNKLNKIFLNENGNGNGNGNINSNLNINNNENNTLFNKNNNDMNDNDVDYVASLLNPRNPVNFKNTEFNNLNENKFKEKYGEIIPTSKDLKMLNNIITIEWTKNWIHDMVKYEHSYPRFMYHDMFLMRDFAIKNTSKNYFYIGYFPSDFHTIHGPYYIGVFELNPPKRSFSTYMVIQNPNYLIENDKSKKRMISFKKEIRAMCEDALVFFKFNMLKNISHDRYYLTWLYEDD